MANSETDEKQLEVRDLLRESAEYVAKQWKILSLFTIAAIILNLLIYPLGGTKSYGFGAVMIALYLLESAFFRFFFDKRPYLQWRPIMRSLAPSLKVVFLAAVFALLLSLLPFIPLLLGIPYFKEYTNSLAYADDYLLFLQRYMQEVPLVDWGLNAILILIAPIILFRPMLAWIAAIMGRRGSLRVAWRMSRGNYGQFLSLSFVFLAPLMILYHIAEVVPELEIGADILSVVVAMFMNVVLAKIYKIFYQD